MSETPVGERIDGWRKFRRMTLRQLASAAGMHTSSLHRVIHGQQKLEVGDADRLAAALDLESIDQLTKEDAPGEPEPEAASA